MQHYYKVIKDGQVYKTTTCLTETELQGLYGDAVFIESTWDWYTHSNVPYLV